MKENIKNWLISISVGIILFLIAGFSFLVCGNGDCPRIASSFFVTIIFLVMFPAMIFGIYGLIISLFWIIILVRVIMYLVDKIKGRKK